MMRAAWSHGRLPAGAYAVRSVRPFGPTIAALCLALLAALTSPQVADAATKQKTKVRKGSSAGAAPAKSSDREAAAPTKATSSGRDGEGSTPEGGTAAEPTSPSSSDRGATGGGRGASGSADRDTAPAPKPADTATPAPAKSSKPKVAIAAPSDDVSERVEAAIRPLWQGGFIQVNVGYGLAGGEAGPAIPDPQNAVFNGGFAAWREKNCLFGDQGCYNKAITTDAGTGLAVAFQFGYNILGWASVWADLAWKGSLGSKIEMAGTGAVSLIAGFHPLRAWRADTPVDLRIYGGYGFFDILYYHETEFQQDATGKAFTGTSIPFGLSTEWRVPESTFAIGLDLRGVRASYRRWVYNDDKDISSDMSADPVTTLRMEGRIIFAWHL